MIQTVLMQRAPGIPIDNLQVHDVTCTYVHYDKEYLKEQIGISKPKKDTKIGMVHVP